jgi:anti-sigma-K factor RskA
MTPKDQTQPEDATRELLGAYALDAVDDVERRRVKKLLASDGAAQTELDQFEGVVDALGDAVEVDPPASLWTAIQNAIDADVAVDSPTQASPAQTTSSSSKKWNFRTPVLAAAAVLAVFVIGGSIFVSARQDNNVPDSIAAMTAMANDAASKPGSRTGVLSDPQQTMSVKVVVDAQGHGFLMTDPLPTLPQDETYQLWAANDGTMISLGMLGSNPQMSLVSIDASVTELALTREPVSGSVSPTHNPMATGSLA